MKKLLSIILALCLIMTCGFSVSAATDPESAICIETLTALNIFVGDENGNLNLEDNITRAEFATLITRILDVKSTSIEALFNDVPVNHWANPAVGTCYNLGIINGYGDGNFGPEDNVTYEQAVKMLVVALGYEPMASQKGGYPSGYLAVANSCGLTKGVHVTSGAATRMTIAQLLYNALDIPMMIQTGFGTNIEFKVQDGTNGTDYKTLLTEMDINKYEGVITATKTIGDSALAVNEIWYKTRVINGESLALEVDSLLTVADGVSVDEYFGYASVVYVKEVRSNKYEVIAIMPGEDSTTITINKKDIESLSNGELKYYKDSFTTKATTLKLEDNLKVYVNNEEKAYEDIVSDEAELLLIENSGNNKYDMIIVKEYDYAIVDDVDVYRERITLKGYGRLQFDLEDEDVVNSFVDADGAPITLDDFSEGDVIAYAKDVNDSWFEVINLGNNYISGAVTEIGTDYVYIDGVEYELYDNYSVSIGDEGVYYLTRTGKIFDSEIDASVSSNYAYILEVGESTSTFNSGWQIKMLTKDGVVKIYDVKDTYELDADIKALDSNITSNAEIRLVTYKLDSNGKIKSISSVVTYDYTGEYNANTSAIANKLIEEDAIVFNVDVNDIEDAFVTSVDALVHEAEYEVLLGKKDAEYEVVVVLKGASKIDYTQDICIVNSINYITYDDADALKIRFYSANNDREKEIIVPEEVINYDEIKTLPVGSLFVYTGSKVVTDIEWIYDLENINSAAESAIEVDKDYELVYGTIDVDGIKSTSKGVNVYYNDGEMVAIKNSSNAYTYEIKGNNKPVITVGDWQAMKEIEGSYFVAVIENGVVSDIITYAN